VNLYRLTALVALTTGPFLTLILITLATRNDIVKPFRATTETRWHDVVYGSVAVDFDFRLAVMAELGGVAGEMSPCSVPISHKR
jgi:hypothetical protein